MSGHARLTLIAEGSTKWQRLIKRWGISFLIGDDVLFDTFGDPAVLLRNMRKFNIDSAKIKHIVLSHDDWDHIAGLWHLLPSREDMTVYICPSFKSEIKDKIVSFGVKLIEAGEPTQVKDNIYTTGELYGESSGRKIFEQSIVMKEKNGLAILCGCAHPGIVNIVQHAKESFKEHAYLLIGGFHLKDNAEDINERIIKELKDSGIRKIAPLHCTGTFAVEVMRGAFGQGFIQVRAGDKIEL